MPIRERIIEARKAAGMTQRDLAYEVGVIKGRNLTAGAVSQWESTRGVAPSVENLAAVSVACNVRFEWLATGRGGRDYVEPDLHPEEYAVPVVSERQSAGYAVSSSSTTESELLRLVRGLRPKQRKALSTFIREFADKPSPTPAQTGGDRIALQRGKEIRGEPLTKGPKEFYDEPRTPAQNKKKKRRA